MSRYNALLNSSHTYRKDVLQALVTGGDLPQAIDKKRSTVHDDELMNVLAERDFIDVERVMNLQYDCFGPLDEELFWLALNYVMQHGQGEMSISLMALVKSSRGDIVHIPGEDLFADYKRIFKAYFNDYIMFCRSLIAPGVSLYTSSELCAIFDAVLKWKGLSERGWRTSVLSRTNFVSIAKSRKKVLIGVAQVRLSRPRLIGLIIHEIGIHVMWSEHNVKTDTNYEEGVGTLVEQLMLNGFYPLRMYRFLAICLAAGVDGEKRIMRETYDLLYDIRRLLRPDESTQKAKEFVAKEVARVYRSLPSNIPGLVYIRDKNYMENNSAIWSSLAKESARSELFTKLVAPWKGAQ
jgi:hypothetical protein